MRTSSTIGGTCAMPSGTPQPELPGRRVYARDPALVFPETPDKGVLELRAMGRHAVEYQQYRLNGAIDRQTQAPRGPTHRPGAAKPLAEELGRRNGTVKYNGFNTHRRLGEYLYNCGPLLAPALARMVARGGGWLDVGAGHVCAMAQFRERVSSKGRLVAVSAGPFTMVHGSANTFTPPAGVVCIANRRLESCAPAELGRFDVVTDVYGAMSYCEQPDVVLRRMLELTQVGGHVFFGVRYGATTFRHPSGAAVEWSDWLQRAPGARLLESGFCDEGGITHWFALQKTSAACGLQRLVLERFVAGSPPERAYRLQNPI